MSQLITLKDKLSKDPFFRALFDKADSAQEAITVASAFGVNLSFVDIMTFRKELRSMIGKQSFHLDLVRPEKVSWDAWGGGEDTSCGGGPGGGCSGYGGAAQTTELGPLPSSSSQKRPLHVHIRMSQATGY